MQMQTAMQAPAPKGAGGTIFAGGFDGLISSFELDPRDKGCGLVQHVRDRLSQPVVRHFAKTITALLDSGYMNRSQNCI